MDNKKKINNLIISAIKEISRADNAASYENEKSASLCAIAKSITAISIMFASDFEKECNDG